MIEITGGGLTAFCAVALLACDAGQEADRFPVALADIRARVAADCAAGRFSGVIAVRRRGQPVAVQACGFADAERRIPLAPGARFKLFSISKTLTATLVLRLAESGRIDLDRSIRAYLPDAPAAWQPVTIRHLLQHRAGIPDYTEKLLDAYRVGGARTHRDALHQVLSSLTEAERRLAGAPGETWRYSNFGYELLAQAVAEAAGQPFDRAMRLHLLEPAGMNGASIELPSDAGGALASAPSPGLVQGFNGAPKQWLPAQSYAFVQQGAGAVHAGYEDLLAFDAAIDRGVLISPEMQRRNVAESVAIAPGVRYGYGWIIRSVGPCTYWQNSGGTNGFTTEYARAPDAGITVVILSNLGFSPDGLRRDIMQALLSDAAAACR